MVSQQSLFGPYGLNPNDRNEQRLHQLERQAVSGTVDAGWGVNVTPVLKMQSGAPYGRFANIPGCTATVTANCLNYGTQLVLVEPIGTRRQDTVIAVRHPRREAVPLRQQGARSACSSTCSTS